jgi:lysine 2,3-aminomutase
MRQDITVCPQLQRPAARDIVLPTEEEEPPGTGLCPPSALRPIGEQSVRPNVVRFPRPRVVRTTSTTRRFRRRFYSDIDDKTWNDWQWQVRNRIRSFEQLDAMVRLSDAERAALLRPEGKLPVGITPYYMSLVAPDDETQPLRRTVIPNAGELVQMPGESDDPLGEEHQSPIPGLVHRYPDRVLLLLSDFCSTYCRYCTRSRMVGHGRISPSRSRLEAAFDYIRANPQVRDVLLSGGDPLTLNDDRLEWVLSRLRQIRHVEVIRIGTKVPAVLPQRVTTKLVRMLRRYHPVWMSLHFTHPDECTPEAYRACARLADAGIPLGSQTVLLRGINDNVATMADLVHELMRMRVRPYYLYQCDPISGSGHFRTPIAKGLEIIRGLRGFTSGYAVPTYVVDAPGGGGKIPLMPEYALGHDASGDMLLRNYEGGVYRYPDGATEVQTRQIH